MPVPFISPFHTVTDPSIPQDPYGKDPDGENIGEYKYRDDKYRDGSFIIHILFFVLYKIYSSCSFLFERFFTSI